MPTAPLSQTILLTEDGSTLGLSAGVTIPVTPTPTPTYSINPGDIVALAL